MSILKGRFLFFLVAVTACAGSSAEAQQYALNTLASFNGANGYYPEAGLILDPSGNLYGTAEAGGANQAGTVFELAAGTHTPSVLAQFSNDTNGGYPHAGVIMDAAGNLYGTTLSGSGPALGGTVFKVANDANHTLSTLVSFHGNGYFPEAGLIADSSGNLYGTTQLGGLGDGVVFEVANNASNTLTILATFNGSNGVAPHAGLTMDPFGNLYGTTESGGANGDGTVFRVTNDSNHTLSTLATFNGTNGHQPMSSLIMDSAGNLYGTTYLGGANNDGTVFEVANDANHTLTTLATFDGANGSNPAAGLVADANGNLYGTTNQGGANDVGVVFELANDESHTLSTLATFNGANGENPLAGLIMDASGNFYGTTEYGGLGGNGTIFELSPVPEPSSVVLALLALCGISILHLRKTPKASGGVT